MGGTGIIDQFLETFTRYIDTGFGLLGGEVGYLATTLGAIDITLAGLFWSWGADEDILARLVKKTLFVGVFADVDYHWKELLGAAALSTLLGVGSELGTGTDNGSNTAILQALRLGAANSLNQTGQQVVRRNLDIQPTLTIRPGFPVRLIVNRDLVLEAYRG
jgi:type IV secretory pathway TrbL component